MTGFTTWDILRNLLLAARWTVALSLIAFLGGFLLGAGLLLLRLSGRRWARRAAGLYVQLFQGTPLLIQLFLCFFGLALVGLDLPPLAAAAVALTLYAAAFLSEIWRGAVEAVPRGQWEAARALALTWPQQLRLVILPQALRVAIAPTVGFLVQVVKGTALASVIGFVELTKAGTMLNNATFRPFLVYSLVALIYFCLCFPLSWWAKKIEGRLNVAR